MPHLHLCNRAGFRDNAAKSRKPGHNRDIGPKTGTVPAKPGHLATMHGIGDFCVCEDEHFVCTSCQSMPYTSCSFLVKFVHPTLS